MCKEKKEKSSYEPRHSLWVTKQIISLIINSKSFEDFFVSDIYILILNTVKNDFVKHKAGS